MRFGKDWFEIRLRVLLVRNTDFGIIVRVQMWRLVIGKNAPPYEFGLAVRSLGEDDTEAGLKVAIRRGVAACFFDPDSPGVRLLIRRAAKVLLRRHYADLTLHTK